MLKYIVVIGSIFMTVEWNKHYMETGDRSIQGFIEYMKDKYYTKH